MLLLLVAVTRIACAPPPPLQQFSATQGVFSKQSAFDSIQHICTDTSHSSSPRFENVYSRYRGHFLQITSKVHIATTTLNVSNPWHSIRIHTTSWCNKPSRFLSSAALPPKSQKANKRRRQPDLALSSCLLPLPHNAHCNNEYHKAIPHLLCEHAQLSRELNGVNRATREIVSLSPKCLCGCGCANTCAFLPPHLHLRS